MKRVLVLATTFPRKKKDTEPAFVYELSNRLNAEVEAVVPHAPHAKVYEKLGKVEVFRFHYFIERLQKLCYNGGIHENMKNSMLATLQVPFLVFFELLAVWRVCKLRKPDVIHAHWVLPQGFVAWLINKWTKIPYVVTVHAGDVFVLKSNMLKKLAGKVFDNAAAITANSTYTKSVVQKMTKKSVDVIPMGVSFDTVKPSSSFRKKNGVAGPMILSAGRLAEKKGIIYLVKATKLLINHYPKLKVIIIGDGPQKESIEKEIVKLKLEDHIILKGKMNSKDISQYYVNADVFVGPSIVTKSGDTEGLGVVFLEALAHKTAVVGSNVGGIPDIINKDTGVLIPQKNPKKLAFAVLSLLQNKKKRETLAQNGYNHVKKNYAWEYVAKKFSKLLQKVSK